MGINRESANSENLTKSMHLNSNMLSSNMLVSGGWGDLKSYKADFNTCDPFIIEPGK